MTRRTSVSSRRSRPASSGPGAPAPDPHARNPRARRPDGPGTAGGVDARSADRVAAAGRASQSQRGLGAQGRIVRALHGGDPLVADLLDVARRIFNNHFANTQGLLRELQREGRRGVMAASDGFRPRSTRDARSRSHANNSGHCSAAGGRGARLSVLLSSTELNTMFRCATRSDYEINTDRTVRSNAQAA